MLRTATSALLLLLTSLSPVLADGGATDTQVGPDEAVARNAQLALDAGRATEAMALLGKRPVAGVAACIYGKASLLLATTPSDRAHALLYLQRCVATTEDSDARSEIGRLRRDLKESPLAQVSLALRPAIATATLGSAYVGDTLLAEDELWLPPGKYRLEVMAPGHQAGVYAVVVASSHRMLVPIVLPEDKSQGPREVDLGDEPGADLGQVSTTADPRPKKFKTLLAKRYQGSPLVTPPPRDSENVASSTPWPALVGGAAIASLGLGVGLQLSSHETGALLSYGASAGLAGLAAFLLLRDDSPADEGTRIQVDDELITLSYQGRF